MSDDLAEFYKITDEYIELINNQPTIIDSLKLLTDMNQKLIKMTAELHGEINTTERCLLLMNSFIIFTLKGIVRVIDSDINVKLSTIEPENIKFLNRMIKDVTNNTSIE